MANNQSDATTKFYMNQANKIVDVLSEILPTIYFNVFKDDFDVLMYGLWMKPDENHPPILDQSVLHMGETFQTLEKINWKTLPEEKQMEWLKRLDLQALLKALRFRPVSLDLFCEKNSLVKEKLVNVLQAMINWRNYGVGHKSVYKYEQMDERVFKLNILEPVWELYDLLSRYYPKECELLRKTLKEIETRMKLPDTSVDRLVALTNKPTQTVRDILALMKVYIGKDGCIKGEDEKELADSIKRLSKKDSVKKNQKKVEPEKPSTKSKKKKIIIIAGVALLILIALTVVLLTQCGKKEAKNTNDKNEIAIENEGTTAEETTVDNRPIMNPFKPGEFKVVEEEENNNNEGLVDITSIKNKANNDLSYKILCDYDNKKEYEDDIEYLRSKVENYYSNPDSLEDNGEETYSEYDDSNAGDNSNYDNSYDEEPIEAETDEYGSSVDYYTGRSKGEILIIVLDDSSVKANQNKNIRGSDGQRFFAYEVKGVDYIRTTQDLKKVNYKSLKRVRKDTEDIFKSLNADSDQKITSKKYIGYYALLPKDNDQSQEAEIYVIYKVYVKGEDENVYNVMNSIEEGTYYYYNSISNPRYNYKGNKQIYTLDSDNNYKVSYGGYEGFSGVIGADTMFTSVKKIKEEVINESAVSHNIIAKPYKKNKEIKDYD